MKLKNKLLLFLGIFIFMIIPKNVYAESIIPYYSKMNTEVIANNTQGYNNWYNMTLNPNQSGNIEFRLASYSYYDSNGALIDRSFNKYPIVIIYFQTWNTPDQIGISKGSGCNSSCFSNHNIVLKQVGTDAASGRYQYLLILQAKKWSVEPVSGESETFYWIEDLITITNNNTSSSTNKAFIFYQVLLSDDNSIYTNNSVDINSLISNANANRQQITNSIDAAKNSINNTIDSMKNSINSVLSSNQQQQHQDMQNINNSLNSEEAPTNNDVSNKTQEWTNKLAGTGPVSNMVLMPITLLNGYVSGMNASCSPFNLGTLYDTQLTLPCINVSNYLGSSLWSIIDVLFSGFMIYAIGKKFVKIFNDFTNLRDNQMDELYGGGK